MAASAAALPRARFIRSGIAASPPLATSQSAADFLDRLASPQPPLASPQPPFASQPPFGRDDAVCQLPESSKHPSPSPPSPSSPQTSPQSSPSSATTCRLSGRTERRLPKYVCTAHRPVVASAASMT